MGDYKSDKTYENCFCLQNSHFIVATRLSDIFCIIYINTPILNLFPDYSDSEQVARECSALKDFSNFTG